MTGRRSTEDTVTLVLVGVVAVFVIGSLTALIIAAFQGQPGGEGIWSGLFAIVTALIGALGGYIGGATVGTRRGVKGPPTD